MDEQIENGFLYKDFESFAAIAFKNLYPGVPFERNWHIEAIAEYLQAVERGDITRLIINLPPRSLKPVDEESFVYTDKGIIKLKEVAVGDKILTHTGNLKKVQQISIQGELSTLQITTNKGRSLATESSHPFLTTEGWRIASDIKNGDILAAVMSQPDCGIHANLEEVRLLGYLIGDGCCFATPQITVNDEIEEADIIRCVEAMGFYPKHYKTRIAKTGRSYGRISIRSGEKRNNQINITKPWIASHGLAQKTSYSKRVPGCVMMGDKDTVRNFLAAYWACDGTMHLKGKKPDSRDRPDFYIGCDSVSRELLSDIQLLLQKLGIDCRIRRKEIIMKTKRQGDTFVSYCLSLLSQDDRYRFVRQIIVPHSKQKNVALAHPRRTDFDQVIHGDEVIKIEDGGTRKCRCLLVEDDHSFVANGLAVHNSFLVARAFPAWVLGRTPYEKFIVASYGHEVAEQNSLACRRIMKSEWYKKLFPHTVISPDLDRNTHFETTKRGQYYAATALSPITGLGCSYLEIDDPLKPMEAMSDTIRNSTNQNIRTTLFSRFDDQRIGKLVMIMQRLHEDDCTGNLMRDGGYTLLKLPSETKTNIYINLKTPTRKYEHVMHEGDLLFPARLSRPILDRMRLDMTEIQYAGQMLQEPVPLGGGEFKEDFVQYYQPTAIRPKEMNIVILCDPAGGEEMNKKKRKSTDWTVFFVIGLSADNNYYWLDCIRDRLNPTERVETLFSLHRKWNGLSGKPPKVGYEKYGIMTDTHYIREKQKQDSYMFPIIELGGSMMKEERIRRLIPIMQQGRFYFPTVLNYVDNEGRRFDLVQEFIKSEMLTFPKSRYDDMLDSASRLFSEELRLTFPTPKLTMAAKAYANQEPEDDSWMSF